jgi:phosphatidylinositol glycan class O
MESKEIFTPAAEITAARKSDVKSAQLPKRSGPPIDEDKAKRAGQVHFKAAHGLVVAFFTLILYIPTPPQTATSRHI